MLDSMLLPLFSLDSKLLDFSSISVGPDEHWLCFAAQRLDFLLLERVASSSQSSGIKEGRDFSAYLAFPDSTSCSERDLRLVRLLLNSLAPTLPLVRSTALRAFVFLTDKLFSFLLDEREETLPFGLFFVS